MIGSACLRSFAASEGRSVVKVAPGTCLRLGGSPSGTHSVLPSSPSPNHQTPTDGRHSRTVGFAARFLRNKRQPLYNTFPSRFVRMYAALFRLTVSTSLFKTTVASLCGLMLLAACSSKPTPRSSRVDRKPARHRVRLPEFKMPSRDRHLRSCAPRAAGAELSDDDDANDTVDGTKNCQPSGDTHVVVNLRRVHAGRGGESAPSIVYVNAVPNGFALKKSVRSASVGSCARVAVAADPLEQRRDGEDLQRDHSVRQVLDDRFFGLVDVICRRVVRVLKPVVNDRIESASVAGSPVEAAPPASASTVSRRCGRRCLDRHHGNRCISMRSLTTGWVRTTVCR